MDIEKGIPIPSRKPNSIYPLIEMVVGDSFLVETDRPEKIRSAVSVFSNRNKDRKFCIRKTDGGYRVWRIS